MNGNKELLLIQPATKYQTKGINMSRPLALAYIAALTPDHWNVRIIDELIEPVDFNARPDLIGISSYTASVNRAYELSTIYRNNNIPVVLGGLHVSMVPEEAEKYADSVVIGEAESVWGKLLLDFEAGKLQKKVYRRTVAFRQPASSKKRTITGKS
ncbi:MAG: B12-binding domain-containing radical SAM protein [Candidatus Hodarchaeota archaeon]